MFCNTSRSLVTSTLHRFSGGQKSTNADVVLMGVCTRVEARKHKLKLFQFASAPSHRVFFITAACSHDAAAAIPTAHNSTSAFERLWKISRSPWKHTEADLGMLEKQTPFAVLHEVIKIYTGHGATYLPTTRCHEVGSSTSRHSCKHYHDSKDPRESNS